MKLVLLLFVFLPLADFSFASPCAKELKNCEGVYAKRRYLYTQPVCVMEAMCDVYCGTMKLDEQQKTFYCGFQSKKGKEWSCLSAAECKKDESVVSSAEDVAQLTINPRSPGSGLRLKESSEGQK